LKRSDYFGDLGATGKILLKWIIKKLGQRALAWIAAAQCTEKWRERNIAHLFHKKRFGRLLTSQELFGPWSFNTKYFFCVHLISTILVRGQLASTGCSLIFNT
jgi:hypothetical protein